MHAKIYKLLIVLAAGYGMARCAHHATAGFRISKIEHSCALALPFEQPPLSEKEKQILSQKFTYLARGLQSFAFVSADGRYVLKLLNNRLQSRLFWSKTFGLHEKERVTEEKLLKMFTSYLIAHSELKEETGLLYAHLLPEPVGLPLLVIVDKLGIEHQVDLNTTGFLLQKKATLVYPWLEEKIQRDELVTAKKGISDLVSLLLLKAHLGIADSDPLLRTNFGFFGNTPIQLDIGPFSKNPQISDSTIYLPEIQRITTSLKLWLKDKSPELGKHLELCLEDAQKTP